MAKHKIEGKVRGWRKTIFRVEKVATTEEDILVHFGHPVEYHVVKLSTQDLPRSLKIRWINNFGVVDAKGNYVENVKYTVFMPPIPKNWKFVYYEKGQLKEDKTARWKGNRPARNGMVQVDFTRGDPGIGIRPG